MITICISWVYARFTTSFSLVISLDLTVNCKQYLKLRCATLVPSWKYAIPTCISRECKKSWKQFNSISCLLSSGDLTCVLSCHVYDIPCTYYVTNCSKYLLRSCFGENWIHLLQNTILFRIFQYLRTMPFFSTIGLKSLKAWSIAKTF